VDTFTNTLINVSEDDVFEEKRKSYLSLMLNRLKKVLLPEVLVGRLLLLNKVHPATPTVGNLRPIVISSPVRKLIEAQLLEKLRAFTSQRIHKAQTGFIPGLGTGVNL